MVCVLLIDSLVFAISERHCENRGIDGFYGSLDFGPFCGVSARVLNNCWILAGLADVGA